MSSKANWFAKWSVASEEKILGLFATLRGACVGGDAMPYVFVPGSRTDRALLVAHCDTVWGDDCEICPIVARGGVWMSRYRDTGIGADDRGGCAALWAIRDLGHSLLITSGEECGCIGSRDIANNYPEILDGHSFLVQYDRRGHSDIVTYDVGTPEFQKYVASSMPGYRVANGTYTDIVELCPAAGVCGVNLSIGYHMEHTPSEFLVESQWKRTVQLSKKWLSSSIERFAYTPRWPNWFDEWKNESSSPRHTPRTYCDEGIMCCCECGQPIVDAVSYRGKSWCDECALWGHDTSSYYGGARDEGGVN